jgi:hypothetical protein
VEVRIQRREIRELINEKTFSGLPHEGVYSRLECSKPSASELFGKPNQEMSVGVRSIRDIKKGERVFAPDDDETVEVPSAAVKDLPQPIRELYYDFCVLRGDNFICPVSFNKLTPSWYVNHSDKPNIAPDQDLKFYALKDISTGDELFSAYEDYSENEQRPII